MDKKKIPEDKIAAEEILKDSELDSIAGGGGTVTGDEFVLPNPTDNIKYGGQLGSG